MDYTHDQIKDILVSCAQECILPYFKNLTADQIDTKSNPLDFVTIADREAEKYLANALQKILPTALVLGEEAYGDDPSLMERCAAAQDVWVIDPVDGTSRFKNGSDEFCTILSHVKYGKVIGAWIYAPVQDKFAAWIKGEHAFVNGVAVRLDTSYKNIDDMVAIYSISRHKGVEVKEIVEKNFSHFGNARRCASLGTDTIRILENEIDLLCYGRGNPWDIAPCAAIVEAFGGKARKIDGAEVSGADLFTIDGKFLAMRCPEQWDAATAIIMQGLE